MITSRLSAQNPNFSIAQMDITDKVAVREIFNKFLPDIVIHLAAETDVEKCEVNPEYAFLVNGHGSEVIASNCQKLNIPCLYLSTLSIFDGSKSTPYLESDNPNPVSVYAKSKLEGEKYIKTLSRFYIIRAGWVVGGAKKDQKFVGKIVRAIKNGARSLNVVTDKKGSVTYTLDLARVIERLININSFDVYNVACTGTPTRFEIAQEIIELMNKKEIVLNPVVTAAIKTDYFSPRPDNESADCTKISRLLPGFIRPWQEALRDYFLGTNSFNDL